MRSCACGGACIFQTSFELALWQRWYIQNNKSNQNKINKTNLNFCKNEMKLAAYDLLVDGMYLYLTDTAGLIMI